MLRASEVFSADKQNLGRSNSLRFRTRKHYYSEQPACNTTSWRAKLAALSAYALAALQNWLLQPTCGVEVSVTEGEPHSKRHWHLQDCKSGCAAATVWCFSVTRKRTDDLNKDKSQFLFYSSLQKCSMCREAAESPRFRLAARSSTWQSGGPVVLRQHKL